jgi:hypothetical protein
MNSTEVLTSSSAGGMVREEESLKPFVWGAIVFHLFLAFHNYCGVDGADFFSHYSQFAFGLPGARYVYFSGVFGLFAIPHVLSCVLHIPLTVCAKFIPVLCWIACSYLVVRTFPNHTIGPPQWWFVCLALNPVAIFNLHYHVQYDSVVLLLMVGGLALYLQEGRAAKILAGVCWAVAISTKVYPALLVPLFVFDRRSAVRDKAFFYGAVVLFFLLPEIPWMFNIGWMRTLTAPLGYRSFSRFGLSRIAEGVAHGGGYGWLVGRLFILADGYSIMTTLTLVAVTGALVFFGRVTLFRAIGLYLALLLLLSAKNAPQYLIFVIPFLPLTRSRGALLLANASYALILAFFYLLDVEMNGSYCLLKLFGNLAISQRELVFWEGYKSLISLYLWGYLYLLATLVFAWGYYPPRSEALGETTRTAALGSGIRSLLCGVALALWCISFFSARFSWNPFSMSDNGLPEVVNCNTVLEPPSTMSWYGNAGEYELEFNGLKPGDAVRVSGDSYFQIKLARHCLGPFRGDGNKLYSFWWGLSYPLTYEALRESGFRVTIINYLSSIRGINTVTARLIGQGRDWDPYGHMLDGKVKVRRCCINAIDYGVELGQRTGWLDSVWLSIRPKNFQFKGASYINIFTIILLYIIVFFAVVGGRLKMGKGER